MGRRKQIVPKKSDNLEGDQQAAAEKNDEGSGTVESDGGSDSNEEPEVIATTLDPPVSPPTSDPPPPPSNTMDLLKNPFLLPAGLLALNPNLYAAQFAQLQAAQLLLSKQNEESIGAARKRAAEEDSPLDLGSKPKYPRASPPPTPGESPLDLSGNKSPEPKPEASPFNPLLPPNILSFFNHLKPPVSGAAPDFSHLLSLAASQSSPPAATAASSPPRSTNPWQNQWLNKNHADHGGRIGDVFKCVWCKESYQTLEALTVHMKEAKHHSMPHPGLPGPAGPLRNIPVSSPSRSPSSLASPVSSVSTSPKPAPVRDILKEQLPLPRKLVRGQDIWIGRADQQTRDILKCMGCGQSFRSLDLLTKHMQETQHYKKVISHDQLSAWKYPESQHTSKNHINSVLTCKVCEKPFGSLKDLSEHMLKANHHTTGESPRGGHRPPNPSPSARNMDRKKALPVKKLLELERARYEVAGGPLGSMAAAASQRDIMETGKLLCERCDDRVPLELFISHIQQCVGKTTRAPVKSEDPVDPTEADKRKDSNASILGSLEQMVKGRSFQASGGGGRKHMLPRTSSPSSMPSSSPLLQPSLYGMARMTMSSMVGGTPSLAVVGSPGMKVGGTPLPSSPGSSSKPSSPALHLSSSSSLEKSAESPGGQTNGKIKQEIDSNNQTDGSAASPSPSSHLSCSPSPHPAEINDAPVIKRVLSPSDQPSPIKVETTTEEKSNPAASTLSPVAETDQKSDNPLAALQMLCDTQRKTPKTPKISESNNSSNHGNMSDPGAMMAFSWACNQAVGGGGGTGEAIKCPFCDTPFISKGAYRHHLSKMHFKEYQASGFPATMARSTPSPPNHAKEDETIQSKYAKYAQLAKQLSCNQK